MKYNDLYNSVPSDNGEMISIDTEINNRVKDGVTAYNICVDDTVKGVRRLKLGKSDGEEGLSSDHIINGPRLLYVLLTMVFNSMLIHGVSPESMLVGTMIPIPKDRRQLRCTSDNFRAITLRGFAKLKKFQKSKNNLDRAQPTHPPPYPNFFFF